MWEFGKQDEGFDVLVPVVITCRQHGNFTETPIRHMMGYGCPICDREHHEELRERLYSAYDKLTAN